MRPRARGSLAVAVGMRVFFFLIFSFPWLPAFAIKTSALNNDALTLVQKVIPDAKVAMQFNGNLKINTAHIDCHGSDFKITVNAKETEWTSTSSYVLRKMGFLFPHPRKIIFPTAKEVLAVCGKTLTWNPQFEFRGFHLHTQHPSEWVDGFFQGQFPIAKDLIWWLAHNQQNTLQLQLLRTADLKDLPEAIELSHDLGIRFGLSLSFAMLQQKSYTLIPFWRVWTHWGEEAALEDSILSLIRRYDFDFMVIELGQTEFNSTDDQKTFEWIVKAEEILSKRHRNLFVKVHVSNNQSSKDFGNFNFIVDRTSSAVGAEVHTVYFYGLNDQLTPMYGRKNFSDLKDFLLKEKNKRQVWYYPETSYFVGLDIDVPLFLTDYLVARAADSKWIVDRQIQGQIDFTTGQELGYWLFDWNVALQSDPSCLGNALCGLKLLGEPLPVWEKILQWQTKYFKNLQAIQLITPSNLMDEIPWLHTIHHRVLLRDLFDHPDLTKEQVSLLEKAVKDAPDVTGVKDPELKALLQVTELRVRHSLCLRRFLDGQAAIADCAALRAQAQALMEAVTSQARYPESMVFAEKSNITSYGYGYGWPAKTLYFWEREEKIVEMKKQNPFFMNLYSPLKLLF